MFNELTSTNNWILNKSGITVAISFRRAYIQSRCCKRRLEPAGRDVIQASGKAGVSHSLWPPYLHELHHRDKAAASWAEKENGRRSLETIGQVGRLLLARPAADSIPGCNQSASQWKISYSITMDLAPCGHDQNENDTTRNTTFCVSHLTAVREIMNGQRLTYMLLTLSTVIYVLLLVFVLNS